MSENGIDVDKIHELFIAGEKLIVIAHKLNVSEGYIQQIISKERKKNPEKWPKRQQRVNKVTLEITKNGWVLNAKVGGNEFNDVAIMDSLGSATHFEDILVNCEWMPANLFKALNSTFPFMVAQALRRGSDPNA